MARNTPPAFLFCLPLLAMCALQPASAEDICGKPRSSQYAEEQLCANVLSFPDGRPATAAMLDSIPETYPWLFPLTKEPVPELTIRISPADAQFSTLQIINGWAPYDTFGAEAKQFEKYSRVKDILIETAGGHNTRHTLQDSGEIQFVTLPEPAASQWVRMKVLSTYPGASEVVALRWFAIVWEEGEDQ